MFITVEGGDGAGKTTHLGFIKQWMSQRAPRVVCTREPGGTPFGERLREILLDGKAPPGQRAELMLFFTARTEHIDRVIAPALADGAWVLCDRFTDASYAYQGGARGIHADAIATLEGWVHGDLQPDLTILLDVSPEVARARTRERGRGGDHFDRESLEFAAAVRAAYLARADQYPQRIKVIAADQPPARVCADLSAVLDTFAQERRL